MGLVFLQEPLLDTQFSIGRILETDEPVFCNMFLFIKIFPPVLVIFSELLLEEDHVDSILEQLDAESIGYFGTL